MGKNVDNKVLVQELPPQIIQKKARRQGGKLIAFRA